MWLTKKGRKILNKRIQAQREFFESGRTRPVKWRLEQLNYLKNAVKQYEQDLLNAVEADLGKGAFEEFAAKMKLFYEEINYCSKHLEEWTKPEKIKTNASQGSGKCFLTYEPRGVVLIVASWTYPAHLVLTSMVSAICAGNCVALKTSDYLIHISQTIKEMIRECFPSEFLDVYSGGAEVTQALINTNLDYILFSGSASEGKDIMRLASEHLIPLTLELSGKNPCIVDRSANLPLTAKRIMWGKLLSCGQTCVAPDYVLVHTDVKKELAKELIKTCDELFPKGALTNPNYGKIINDQHFDRLVSMLDMGKIIYGGQYNKETLKIAPTIIDQARLDSPLMKEEIFGPLLPLFNFESLDDVFALIRRRHRPLALYIFSEDEKIQQKIMNNVAYGGGCINDTILHVTNPKMPFSSNNMGGYHGKAGFNTFSHQKSILKQSATKSSTLWG